MLDRVLTTAVMVGRHVGIEEGGRIVRNAYLSLRACVMARRGQHGNSAAESGRRNAPNINSGVRQAIINWLYDPWKSQISSRIRGSDGMEFAEDESMYQAIPLLVVAVIVSHDWKYCCCCCCRSGSTPDLLAKVLLGGLARPQPHFNNCAAATPREEPLQPRILLRPIDAVRSMA
jgi:hypothetical protein